MVKVSEGPEGVREEGCRASEVVVADDDDDVAINRGAVDSGRFLGRRRHPEVMTRLLIRAYSEEPPPLMHRSCCIGWCRLPCAPGDSITDRGFVAKRVMAHRDVVRDITEYNHRLL